MERKASKSRLAKQSEFEEEEGIEARSVTVASGQILACEDTVPQVIINQVSLSFRCHLQLFAIVDYDTLPGYCWLAAFAVVVYSRIDPFGCLIVRKLAYRIVC